MVEGAAAPKNRMLVILYGSGGLSDVGRHAVQAALEIPGVECKVLTQHPEMLEESNWKCGCPQGHQLSEQDRKRIQVIPVKSWKDTSLSAHFQGATGVVSCLGNREPFIGDWVAEEGNNCVIWGANEHKVDRVVVMSSVGIEEDWKPLEWHWAGIILACLFLTIGRKSYKDLTAMEKSYRTSNLDYLIVRPTGLGEDVVPVGKWFLQKEKHKDSVGIDLAKLDCARFMVQEALNPTLHKEAVVVGSEPPGQQGCME
jgi:hypothetical protein